MREISSIINRQMKRYFRNKGVVVFSILSVLIVSALYIFFLADMQIDYVKKVVGNIQGIDNMINSWIIGGLVCIPAVSVPLIMLCFKVDDVVDKTQDDLMVTPAKRVRIMLGYVISALIVGLVMTLICFVLGEVFICTRGGSLLSLIDSVKIIGMLILVIFTFTGFEFFIISFMKTSSSVTVANSLLNVLLGFLLGLYVPIGMLGDKIATIIKAFPLLQSSSIIRQILMKNSLNEVLSGAPSNVIAQVREMYGVDIVISDELIKPILTIAILLIFGIMCYAGSILVFNHRKVK